MDGARNRECWRCRRRSLSRWLSPALTLSLSLFTKKTLRAEKRSVAEQLPIALTVAVGTAMASPLAAQVCV